MSKLKAKPFNMKPGDFVLTAWGENCAGPGWANSPIWVLIVNSGNHRVECIQPNRQTAEMLALHSISATVNASMTAAIRRALNHPSIPWVVRP